MNDTKDNNEYILLYHRGNEMDISEFMDKNHIREISVKDLFEFNREFIWSQMSEDDKVKEEKANGLYPTSSSDLKIETWLPSPCLLRINPSKVTAELAISQTNAQVNTDDFYAFADEKIQSILQDDGYKIDTTTKRNLDCNVFGWFKSLYWTGYLDKKNSNFNKESSQFSDLSKYIISLATTVTENGGSFVLRLPIISARNIGVKVMNNKDNKGFGFIGMSGKEKTTYRFNNGEEYYSKAEFGDVESNYFNWLISSNDLIFISFEKLKMETKRGSVSGDEDGFDIESNISEGVYDLIGLVDDVKVITNSQNSEAYVEVTGRDFMKLLIEDGSFFFNYSTSSDPSKVFANQESEGMHGDVRDADLMNGTSNNPLNRLRRISTEIDIFANRMNMDIDFILKGVISQLANVEVVPSYVFDSWGGERTKFIDLQPKEK